MTLSFLPLRPADLPPTYAEYTRAPRVLAENLEAIEDLCRTVMARAVEDRGWTPAPLTAAIAEHPSRELVFVGAAIEVARLRRIPEHEVPALLSLLCLPGVASLGRSHRGRLPTWPAFPQQALDPTLRPGRMKALLHRALVVQDAAWLERATNEVDSAPREEPVFSRGLWLRHPDPTRCALGRCLVAEPLRWDERLSRHFLWSPINGLEGARIHLPLLLDRMGKSPMNAGHYLYVQLVGTPVPGVTAPAMHPLSANRGGESDLLSWPCGPGLRFSVRCVISRDDAPIVELVLSRRSGDRHPEVLRRCGYGESVQEQARGLLPNRWPPTRPVPAGLATAFDTPFQGTVGPGGGPAPWGRWETVPDNATVVDAAAMAAVYLRRAGCPDPGVPVPHRRPRTARVTGGAGPLGSNEREALVRLLHALANEVLYDGKVESPGLHDKAVRRVTSDVVARFHFPASGYSLRRYMGSRRRRIFLERGPRSLAGNGDLPDVVGQAPDTDSSAWSNSVSPTPSKQEIDRMTSTLVDLGVPDEDAALFIGFYRGNMSMTALVEAFDLPAREVKRRLRRTTLKLRALVSPRVVSVRRPWRR